MKKEIIGFLLLVILTSSFYIILPDNVKIDIQKTKSVFSVWEDDSWVVSGIEWVNLFDGTAKMRAKERGLEQTVDGTIVTINRYAHYKDNISVYEIYTFDGSTEDVELFPISHNIQVINGQGKILQYEVTDLLYTGITTKDIKSPQNYGHKMKVEWDVGNYYSKIYKYFYKDEGKLTVKYRLETDDEIYNVRLFDPPKTADDFFVELGNYEVGFTKGYVEFVFANPTFKDITINESNLNSLYTIIQGKVLSEQYTFLTVTPTKTIKTDKTTCTDNLVLQMLIIHNNETGLDEEVEVEVNEPICEIVKVDEIVPELKEKKKLDSLIVPKGESITLRIDLTYVPNTIVDWIPEYTIDGIKYKQVKYLWFNDTRDYRKNITVEGIGLDIPDNYQTLINVTYDAHMLEGFDDLIFTWLNTTSSLEQEIDYWVASQVNGSSALVWVEVPKTYNTTNTTLYNYYGNDTATSSLSNVYDVMLAYDLFDDASINASIWNTHVGNGGAISESSGELLHTGDANWWGSNHYTVATFNKADNITVEFDARYPSYYTGGGGNGFGVYIGNMSHASWGSDYSVYYDAPYYNSTIGYSSYSLSCDACAYDTSYKLNIKSGGLIDRYIVAGTYNVANVTDGSFVNPQLIEDNYSVILSSGIYSAKIRYFDNFRIRLYTPTEPTITFGAEEEQSTEFIVYLNSPANETITTDNTPDFNFTVNGSEDYYSCELFVDNVCYGVSEGDWQSDTGIISGLGDVGARSMLDTFYKDNNWYLITGEAVGTFFGYNWTGSTWQGDTSIISGLGDVGDFSTPNIFYKDSTWYLISGAAGGTFFGYNWTGSEWQSDTNIVSGLSDVGQVSSPDIFYKDSTWYLISGNYVGTFNGWNWTGSTWQGDTSIISGLGDVGARSSLDTFYKDNNWYLIAGEADGIFNGYNWTDGTWQSDTDIVFGLSDVGDYSTPDIFYKDNNWYLISGEADGIFNGYTLNLIQNDTATIITANATVSDGTYNWYVNCTSDSIVNQSEIREITIDTTEPQTTVYSPTNTTYSTISIDLNVSADETIDTWWYSLNAGINTTFIPNSSSLNTSSFCYQETANISTDCGGLNTGDYSGNYSNWYDENWGTSSSIGYNSVYVNYTKPFNSLNTSLWVGKSGSLGVFNDNMTIPQTCWDYDINKLILRYIGVSGKYFQCYNGTLWITTGGTGSGYSVVYEEAMWWDIIDLIEGQNNIVVWANDTVGNENSASVYFTVDTIPPQITVYTPENITYYDINELVLNVTVNEELIEILYDLNDGGNISLPLMGISYINGSQMDSILFTDMVTDSNDDVHVILLKSGALYYAFYNGTWILELVNSTLVATGEVSISVNSTNIPYIVYKNSTSGFLGYGYRNGFEDWILNDLSDSSVSITAPNIAIDGNDDLHISFWNNTNHLGYIFINDTGCYGEALEESTKHNDIAVDSNNIPHIIYSHTSPFWTKHAYKSGDVWVTEYSHPVTYAVNIDMKIINDKIYYSWYSANWLALTTNKNNAWTTTQISTEVQEYDTSISVSSNGGITRLLSYNVSTGIGTLFIVQDTTVVSNISITDCAYSSTVSIIDKYYIMCSSTTGSTKFITVDYNFNKTISTLEGQNNVTIYATDLIGNVNSTTVYFYMINTSITVNYTSGEYLDFAATSYDGIFPAIGQNDTTPSINITNIGNIILDVNITVNTTQESCMSFWMSDDATLNVSEDYNVTNTEQILITDLDINESNYLWSWMVFDSCTAGNDYWYTDYYDSYVS